MAKKRKSRAKFTTRFRNAIKKIRSALATLKRKKIIPKTTDVRKALPSKATRALVRKHKEVVSGAATSYKLPSDIPKQILADLKSLGYKTTGRGENRRIIVPTTQYLRKGKVYERPTRSRKGFRVERSTLLPGSMDIQVRTAFERLKSGDMVGFEVGGERGIGGRSFNLYSSPESMLAELMAYQERGFKFTHLAVFKVTQAKQPDFRQDASRRARERVIGSPERRAARNARAKEARVGARGLRGSRGH